MARIHQSQVKTYTYPLNELGIAILNEYGDGIEDRVKVRACVLDGMNIFEFKFYSFGKEPGKTLEFSLSRKELLKLFIEYFNIDEERKGSISYFSSSSDTVMLVLTKHENTRTSSKETWMNKLIRWLSC